jgi:hypothetical protein
MKSVLPKDFCIYMLALYKPFIKSYTEYANPVDELYLPSLLNFLWDANMPGDIRANILRARRQEQWHDDPVVGGLMVSNGTSSDEQVNNANKVAAEVADNELAAAQMMVADSLEMNADMKVQIKWMNKRCKVHDWSENYNTSVAKALNKYMEDL